MRILGVTMAVFIVVSSVIVYRVLQVQSEDSCKAALIIVDVQNCFLEGGSLGVKYGSQVVPVINQIRSLKGLFDSIVLSQDWHPEGHVSFFSTHKGKTDSFCSNHCTNQTSTTTTKCQEAELFQPFILQNCQKQILWPDHCIQGTFQAQIATNLTQKSSDIIIKKGASLNKDSYSVFFDNDGKTKTELEVILKSRGVATVVLVGLAFDFCVGFSALDARKLGFNTIVIEDATRAVSEEAVQERREQMQQAGVRIVNSNDLLAMDLCDSLVDE
eukprot:TRINITY_DN19508_c0_g1_i1.p1 TRINITY_DN19508_c0_g1~~TRINITY_DN19508_c0_g1_i1.p1  ORF type:complete len:272 (-),score=23.91 TRINITY_DN19508_c0_g1_i1:55-870(-)